MHRYVLYILFVVFFTELINSILVYNSRPIRIPFNISIIFHDIFWMLAFREIINRKKMSNIILCLFVLFSVVNFIVIEITDAYNYYTFVFGALLYVSLFIYESYKQLKEENLMYFLSNNYLLLFAPVYFFFGMGLMLGFKALGVTKMLLFGQVTLYVFIVNIVCIAYYSLINIYIYRENNNYK
ncbi:hypothetical protein B0A68_10470 [Flavobacterium reichenbachii]|uniref:Uncharacterized protein n=1 Tax=Flavobacterium reichenbachii TaxID=362418 RepID=A0A085ZFF8_9FLAO|nr:hypothetical protein IW19_19830 [Flavobacterium reichenbachii]OXB15147.1 hypothetical protein B0A68_10470 [Flavobacterium reichenbachii]